MEKFEIVAKQIPGEVRFDNYEELKMSNRRLSQVI